MNNDIKYIGISSGFVGGIFVAYFVFSRWIIISNDIYIFLVLLNIIY
jgi:hypothetical protein